ncbi:cupin domain-containing protein [Paenibacillus sp. GCM10023252]|uniref:cupin domain-containing protein n=1 Tax=Paenibacillus sp. GCM10023252 TaxID=3252649 RepID=UPI0036162358
MIIRNFLSAELVQVSGIHDGVGTALHKTLYGPKDFTTNLRFINYTILPAGATIGLHTHGDDEEIYIVLEGSGEMTANGEVRQVKTGDLIVNPPFGTHGLVNNTKEEIRLMVIGIGK